MDQPLNGQRPGALDLSNLKAQASAREQLAAQHDALTVQLLRQAGLICACGTPLPTTPILYYRVEEGPVQTPQGVQVGLNLAVHPCCSQTCQAAAELEHTAAVRRKGQSGSITLLPAGRRALSSQTG